MTPRVRIERPVEGTREGDAKMSLTGTSVSLMAVVASISAILAVAIIWLMLTDPVGMAGALGDGQVTPLVKELANVILVALQKLARLL